MWRHRASIQQSYLSNWVIIFRMCLLLKYSMFKHQFIFFPFKKKKKKTTEGSLVKKASIYWAPAMSSLCSGHFCVTAFESHDPWTPDVVDASGGHWPLVAWLACSGAWRSALHCLRQCSCPPHPTRETPQREVLLFLSLTTCQDKDLLFPVWRLRWTGQEAILVLEIRKEVQKHI